jgi:diacylglycerol kinase (ATP)
MTSGKFSIKSRLKSFRFAFHGLWSLLKNEHNSRIHLLAAILAIVIGIVLKITSLEWCLLTIVISLVFITELLNSSLETIADIVDPELNEQIKKAKDYAAAAVLVSAIMAAIAGGIIFIPKIIALF